MRKFLPKICTVPNPVVQRIQILCHSLSQSGAPVFLIWIPEHSNITGNENNDMAKVITKSKVGSLKMQPAKHDVTGMPLYQMYPYPIRSSTLWLAIHTLVLLVNTTSIII